MKFSRYLFLVNIRPLIGSTLLNENRKEDGTELIKMNKPRKIQFQEP